MITAAFDVSQFTAAMGQLAQISGRDFAHVVRSEMASAVRICASQARMRSQTAIAETVKTHYRGKYEAGGAILSETQGTRKPGSKGYVWFRSSAANYFRYAGKQDLPRMTVKHGPQAGKVLKGTAHGWRLRAWEWAAVQSVRVARDAYIRAETARRIVARGLSLAGWVQITDSLGFDINAVAPKTRQIDTGLARRGIDRKGRHWSLGQSYEEFGSATYLLTVTNDTAAEKARNGQDRLNSALNRRTKAFQNNLAHGVFLDVKARMARYPGMFVTGDTPPDNN